ncbi:hypothetical protein HK104_005603, partial [Borealophlyctis nickersoniae]
MLDQATVLTKGGIVLWSHSYTPSASPAPIDSLIRSVLVGEQASARVGGEGKGDAEGYVKDSWRVKWSLANDVGVVFVIVYQKILHLPYTDTLLESFHKTFLDRYKDSLGDERACVMGLGEGAFDGFEDVFEDLVREAERTAKRTQKPRTFQETAAYANTVAGQRNEKPNATDAKPTTVESSIAAASSSPPSSPRGRGGGSSKPAESSQSPKMGGKGGRGPRVWDHGMPGTASQEQLDFSDTKEGDDAVVSEALVGTSLGQRTADGLYDALELDDNEYEEEDEGDDSSIVPNSTDPKPSKTGLFSFLHNLTSSKTLSKEDLEPTMLKMREHLINKNVAAEIASHLCDSVTTGLVGQQIAAFTSLRTAVKQQMESALKRILTPASSTDVLRDIFAAKASNRPYTIVFVGVNGVGKSTNLSKICFWLLQNKLKVLIAACDTFRSGAVEQLRVHARNLMALEEGSVVDLFDRGYGKDPAGIAKDAIQFAKTNHHDVVLIDTAGRMQDNEPLMRALAK